MSPQIAIENGLKLIDHCFEKHKVNLDPSSSQSVISTNYRPIDKFTFVQPALIGSDKWNEKRHVGLLASDIVSHAESEQFAESIDSNHATSSSLQQPQQYELMIPSLSLMASQDNLAKSTSSIVDQLGALFDEDEQTSFGIMGTPAQNFFRPHTEQRRNVNLFDDEPPSLEPSPIADRKPVNLFDDYDSVDSFPELSTSENIIRHQQQPVDLFNDNEFDDYIKKIESQPNASDKVAQANAKKPESKPAYGIVLPDMRMTDEEIKKVQLKKVDQVVKEDVPASAVSIKKIEPKQIIPEIIKQKEPEKVLPAAAETKPCLKKVTNLFDDDEDEEDYFSTIVKQKSASKPYEPLQSTLIPVISKLTNLFDDEDDDNTFEEIFSKKPLVNDFPPDVTEPKPLSKKSNSSFDDDKPPLFVQSKPETVKKKILIFDEHDECLKKSLSKKVPKMTATIEPKEKPPVALAVVEVFETTDVIAVEPVIEFKKESEKKILEPVAENIEKIGEISPPSVETDNEHSIISENIKPLPIEATKHKAQPSQQQQPSLSSTLPFLSDEPPDDDETWEIEDSYEDPEPIVRTKSLNYPVVPIFDDVPPDDDFGFVSMESPPTELISDEENEIFSVSVINEKPETPKIESITKTSTDELDRSMTPVSIKNKKEIFKKKVEKQPCVNQPKKPLPGKLNTNIKINVGALIPGARLPTKEMANFIVTSEAFSDDSYAQTSATTPSTDPNNNSNLLNNELVKSRARIPVKRRPSTRRGRQASYRRSVNDETNENSSNDIEEKVDTLNKTMPPLMIVTKNLAASIFDDMDDDEEITTQEKRVANHFGRRASEPLSPAELSPNVVTTNKIAVFYDDEDDTRMMVEQRKIKEQAKTIINHQNSTIGLFADGNDDGDDFWENLSNVIAKAVIPKFVQSGHSRSVFYEESDDDLFGSSKQLETVAKSPTQTSGIKPVPKVEHSNSLFDDVEEDDLFESVKKKALINAVKKSKKSVTSKPKKQSLYNDSDDDDLFSSKPKCKKLS